MVEALPPEEVPMAVSAPAQAAAELHLSTRFYAHAIDLSLVLGVSFYGAKVMSLLMLSYYNAEIAALGAGSASFFAEAFDYTHSQLFSASAAFLAMVYFVGLPAVAGTTLGLGLMGLRITDTDGNRAQVLPLARRLLCCVFVYLTFGALLIPGLRGRRSSLPQDIFSATFVRSHH